MTYIFWFWRNISWFYDGYGHQYGADVCGKSSAGGRELCKDHHTDEYVEQMQAIADKYIFDFREL